jgi:hypothetical protein
MKIKYIIILMLCIQTRLLYADCGKENPVDLKNSDGKSPIAVISESDGVFQPVVEGTQVFQDIEVRNIGDGTLIIRKIGAG